MNHGTIKSNVYQFSNKMVGTIRGISIEKVENRLCRLYSGVPNKRGGGGGGGGVSRFFWAVFSPFCVFRGIFTKIPLPPDY